jgi:outer membrane protein OmpA-like peptidoglycan-associated protein
MPSRIRPILPILCLLAGCLLLTGCAAVLVGAGAGAGAIAYVQGKAVQTFESDYNRTVLAVADTLEDLKIPVEEKLSDALKTTIKAKRPDETPVTVDVVRLEPGKTEVGVRTGDVGVMNRKVSHQILSFVEERLAQPGAAETASRESTSGPSVAGGFKEADLPETRPQPGAGAADSDAASPAVLASRVFTIFFDHDREELTENQMQKLDLAAEYILGRADSNVSVNGYTDSSGDGEYNRMISLSRANVVKIYLVGKGIDAERIEVTGHGEKNFIADNATPQGRRINRRVEIEVNSPYR